MVDDQQHLAAVELIVQELQAILVAYNQRANGVTDKKELIEIRLEELDALADSVKKNKRMLHHLDGRPVEPEVHFGAAVLLPVGGLG